MPDEVLDALEQLVAAVEATTKVNDDILRRAEQIRLQRAAGCSWREVVTNADAPLVVELVRRNLDALFDAGGRLRRAEAKALHDEGMTMEEIAKTFGVSRQRVSALLKDHSARTNGHHLNGDRPPATGEAAGGVHRSSSWD